MCFLLRERRLNTFLWGCFDLSRLQGILKCITEDRVSPLPRYLSVRDASHAEIFHYGSIMTDAHGGEEIGEAEQRQQRSSDSCSIA